jgi:predicted GNAT superfamily acetyltransferase
VTMSVRLAGPADRSAVLSLIQSAHEDAVTERVRDEQGFVQGHFDEEMLAKFENGTGIFLAEDRGELAGVALTSDGSDAARYDGPPRLTIDAVATTTSPVLLYGPVVVAPRFRGRGVLRQLLAEIGRRLGEAYPRAALFVEQVNRRSMIVHRGLGMREHAEFTVDGREYTVFVFEPRMFVPVDSA